MVELPPRSHELGGTESALQSFLQFDGGERIAANPPFFRRDTF